MKKVEQQRLAKWRAGIIRHASESENVALTCRRFGISRPTFYKWVARFEAHGEAGLCDRPKTPHSSPKATPTAVVSKVLYLRQNYHFGPARIAAYLKRYHELAIASSTVHRIP